MTDEREKFLKKLAHLGEEDVREKHEKNHFGPPDSTINTWTQDWLKGKEKEAQAGEAKDKEVSDKENQSAVSSGLDEKTGEDAPSEYGTLSPAEIDARRKKAVKTVIVIGIISVLIFLYTLSSGS